MKRFKTPLSVRGDSYYCPLAFALDTYWNCLTDCHHCFLRGLNRVWGQDLRPVDLDLLERKLASGVRNKNPRTPLAHCLADRKTIRFGNKTDPFQDAEKKWKVSEGALVLLQRYQFSYVIQTRFTENMMACERFFSKELSHFMPVVSPGLDRDWEILERGRTTPPRVRLKTLSSLLKKGFSGGVNGEPFIPGFHTVKDFEDTLKLLKSFKINRYNTYNLHLNYHVAVRLAEIGLDIEHIWEMNQDYNWKPILQQLIDLAQKYDILLGCPDFVNSGPGYREDDMNTCCGLTVPNPTRWNTHWWKNCAQTEMPFDKIVEWTWDGTGDRKIGEGIILGTAPKNVFTLVDAGLKVKRTGRRR